MPGSVEDEWIRVAEDLSFIMSLFGFCNKVLKIRRLMVITRRTMRAMLVTLADTMQNIRFPHMLQGLLRGGRLWRGCRVSA